MIINIILLIVITLAANNPCGQRLSAVGKFSKFYEINYSKTNISFFVKETYDDIDIF